MKSLPINIRLPMMMVWQSGMEINRVLSLTWKDAKGIDEGEYPLKFQFYGGKKHKKPYHTYVGRDSINHLKLWREMWSELQGREPQPTDLTFMGKRKRPVSRNYLNEELRKPLSCCT